MEIRRKARRISRCFTGHFTSISSRFHWISPRFHPPQARDRASLPRQQRIAPNHAIFLGLIEFNKVTHAKIAFRLPASPLPTLCPTVQNP
jgi:hypothetical protein